jgi:DNA-binding transcriptional LysR family regulator
MHEVTLRQLEYFAAIAETGTVTAAAQRCNVSQGAVSLALAELERLVGATLVIRRRGKGVALTPEGKIVAARARQVTDQVADIATVVEEFHGRLSGRIVVGVFRTLAMYAIPHLIDWFARHHPGVELDFVEGSGPVIQDEMLAGRVQVCAIYEAQLAAGCTGTELHDARRMVALSPEHELARLDRIRMADLARHPAILVDEEPALRRTLAAFEVAGLVPRVMWRSASVQAIQNVVGRNLAYSLLMQPTSTSPEGRPLTYRQLTDGAPRNAVMASLPTGLRPTRLISEALVALQESWHPSP